MEYKIVKEGNVNIHGVVIRCYITEFGSRMVDARDIIELVDIKENPTPCYRKESTINTYTTTQISKHLSSDILIEDILNIGFISLIDESLKHKRDKNELGDIIKKDLVGNKKELSDFNKKLMTALDFKNKD